MIKKIQTYGSIPEFAYLYIDDKTKHGFLIDPGSSALNINDVIKTNNYTIEKILITHGHFDHIGAALELSELLNAPIYSYSDEYLKNPKLNLSFYSKEIVINNSKRLDKRITIESNPNFYLDYIYAPGHTTDSVIYVNDIDNIGFVGDVVFKGSYGRYDLPGGSKEVLFNTLFNVIFKLNPDMILYSGHSEETKVKDEINNYL